MTDDRVRDWQPKMHDVGEAVAMLRAVAIPATETAYGFALAHLDLGSAAGDFGSCCCEHDCSINLSLRIPEISEVANFFRFDFREVAALLIGAYSTAGGPTANASAIVAAVHKLDRSYDADDLQRRLDSWHAAFDTDKSRDS